MTDEAEIPGGAPAPESQQNEAQPDRAAIEAEARQMGWRPNPEQMKDPSKFIDAEEYVRRGKEHLPIVRAELKRTREEIEELKRSNKEFGEYHRQTIERERKKHEADIASLRQTQQQAVVAQDLPAYHDAQQKIERLQQTMPEPPKKVEEPTEAPEVAEFRQRNDWFERDAELNAAVQAYHVALHKREPGLSLAENLKRTEEHIKRVFPEKFGNVRRNAPAAVDGGGFQGGASQQKRKGYNDLPADARAACDKWTKSGHMTREEYIASYQWD